MGSVALVYDGLHYSHEILKTNLTLVVFVSLLQNLVNPFLRNPLTLSVEYFLQSLFSYVSRIINIKVMESEPKILHRKSFLFIYSSSKKNAIVDVSITIIVKTFENLFKVTLIQMNILQCLPYFISCQYPSIIFIKSSKGIPQLLKINILIQIID